MELAVNMSIVKGGKGEQDYKLSKRGTRFPGKRNKECTIFNNVGLKITTTKGKEIIFIDWAEKQAKSQPYTYNTRKKKCLYLEKNANLDLFSIFTKLLNNTILELDENELGDIVGNIC